MEPKVSGGCACGAVRYDCAAKPTMIFNCHCRDCQRFAGSACTTAVIVPESDLNISGELTCYPSIGDSGGLVHRFFCPKCGTPIAAKPERLEGLKAIKASSLDDNAWVQPSMDLYTISKQPWIGLSESTQKFERGRSA